MDLSNRIVIQEFSVKVKLTQNILLKKNGRRRKKKKKRERDEEEESFW
jgi:hypothetical protein